MTSVTRSGSAASALTICGPSPPSVQPAGTIGRRAAEIAGHSGVSRSSETHASGSSTCSAHSTSSVVLPAPTGPETSVTGALPTRATQPGARDRRRGRRGHAQLRGQKHDHDVAGVGRAGQWRAPHRAHWCTHDLAARGQLRVALTEDALGFVGQPGGELEVERLDAVELGPVPVLGAEREPLGGQQRAVQRA